MVQLKNADVVAGIAKFSATHLTVGAKCFQKIFQN